MPTGLYKFLVIVAVLVTCVSLTTPGFARGSRSGSFGGGGGSFGGGSSGGHSFGGGSSWGGGRSSAPTSSSGWGSSTRSSAPAASTAHPGYGSGASGFGSSNRSTTSRPSSAADRALYQKAQAQGTAFNDRSSAVNNFKSRYSSQYTSHYASEPSVRPAYIPQTYNHYTVIYNHSYGGYGYWGPGHTWMWYDMMTDAIMMNQMMRMNGYYYGASPGYYQPTVVYHSRASSFFWALFWIAIIILIIYLLSRRSSWRGNTTTVVEYDEPVVGMAPPVYANGPAVGVPHTQAGPVTTATPAAFSSGPRRADYTHEEQRVFDNDNATTSFWRTLPLGSVVSLSDEQALEDSAQEGRGRVARDFTVEEIRTITEMNGLATWKLFRLYEVKQELWLMAKLVDDAIDLRVYYQVPETEFKSGNRRAMVDNGMLWLFQQPADPNHFHYTDLHYTMEISGPSEPGQPPLLYELKDQGEMHGTMVTVNAKNPLGERCFVTLVEYGANRDCENPELLLLEMGGVNPEVTVPDSEEGGLIVMLQGAPLNDNEIEVLAGKKP